MGCSPNPKHQPPEPCAQVRILPRAPLKTRHMQAKRWILVIGASATDRRYLPLSATDSVTRRHPGRRWLAGESPANQSSNW